MCYTPQLLARRSSAPRPGREQPTRKRKFVRRRVVVTGLGCICPVGSDTDSAWKNILAGRSGVGPITQFETSGFETRFAGEVRDFDPTARFGAKEARRMDRYTQFAMTAADEALRQAGLRNASQPQDRIGGFIGTGIGGGDNL